MPDKYEHIVEGGRDEMTREWGEWHDGPDCLVQLVHIGYPAIYCRTCCVVSHLDLVANRISFRGSGVPRG